MDNGGKKGEEMDIGEGKDERREKWASARMEQWVGSKSTGREGELTEAGVERAAFRRNMVVFQR